MPHQQELLLTIAFGLTLAFAGGLVALKLRLPPLVGYLLAGIALGPFTPGYTADAGIATQLAEIGIILLMFGVGIHFSLRELRGVSGIAIPGAVAQSAVATGMGMVVATWWGWGAVAGLVLGLAVSVASTVVLLRALAEDELLQTSHGHIAIGWLMVEDLFTVLLLVLLPALAPLFTGQTELTGDATLAIAWEMALTLGKVALFVALMFFLGARLLPWLLQQVANSGSRELFTLGVLAMALGVAVGSATIFGVSLALGAFLAGVVISESDLSYQAAADALPLRDAFAVLFFVSVGMLLNPHVVLDVIGPIIAVLVIILVGKPLVALLITLVLGHPIRSALVVAAGLAQVGEFSFILSELGRHLELMPDAGYHIVLSAAIVSITANPFLFRTLGPLETWLRRSPQTARLLSKLQREARLHDATGERDLRGHVVFCGYGQVGRVVSQALERRGFPYVVVEAKRQQVAELVANGVAAIYGDAANPLLLDRAGLAQARALVVVIPDPMIVRHIVRHAKSTNPALDIVVIVKNPEHRAQLQAEGVAEAVLGDLEVALEVTRHVLHRFGVDGREIQAILGRLRQIGAA